MRTSTRTTCAVLVILAGLCGVAAAQGQPSVPRRAPVPSVPATMPAGAARDSERYFAIRVVDDQTGRGVPLVELKSIGNVRYYTDSAGWAAIDDPVLMGRMAFFFVASHGYELQPDGFGMRGRRLEVTPGGSAELRIKRINIAERLYRVTGEGIYLDSVRLGKPVPTRHPLLNAQVSGQDSVQAAVYRGKIHWFWGDTARPSYPLGHFWMAGAVSELPENGGPDPAVGVDPDYFTDDEGFSRGTVPREDVPAWLDGVMVLPNDRDGDGRGERMVGTVGLFKSLSECVGRRLVVWNDGKQSFDVLQEVPLDAPLYPTGHPFRATTDGADGAEYYYFPRPFPDIRVRADLRSVRDLSSYEAFTCLAPGARYEKEKTRLERGPDGRLAWAWKKDAAALNHEQVAALVKAGKMKPEEAWFRPVDAASGKPIILQGGSVAYNAFRKKWVMIAVQVFGESSVLGEVWYAEADRPEGPWPWARKIVTHDRYSLYNPKHHAFFDREGGRVIYFEGTYAGSFSREGDLTPRYDYNQVMYRLDLSDPRLAPPTTLPAPRP